MLKNYLKITLRHVLRQKGYTLLTISGLALGLACCLFIFLFVRHEVTYDRFHEHGDRIVRVTFDTGLGTFSSMPALLAPPLQRYLPDIEAFVRFDRKNDAVIQRAGGLPVNEERVVFADSTFFDVFSFGLVRGNPKTALLAPHRVVLSQAAAARYFTGEDPMGQVLRLDNEHDLVVTGILDEIPANSSLQFDFLVSFSTYGPEADQHPWNYQVNTFLLVHTPAAIDALPARIEEIYEDHIQAEFTIEGMTFGVERLTDIHFHSDAMSDLPSGELGYIYILSAIALLVLLIASVNYMNLATARYTQRTKEVGVRKALGARRLQLARQFLAESVLTVLAAFLLALGLVELGMPAFEGLVEQRVRVDLVQAPLVLLLLLGGAVCVGLLAGSYPALFLSRFRPAQVLKGTTGLLRRGQAGMRRVLVVLQFTITVALTVSALVVYQQLHYVREARLGFDTEHVVQVPLHQAHGLAETVKAEMQRVPGVLHASAAMDMPMGGFTSQDEIGGRNTRVRSLVVDHDFKETMGLELAEGRFFSRDFPSDDTAAVVINETLARLLEADPEVEPGRFGTQRVVGVVKDFNMNSLHHPMAPGYLRLWPKDFNRMLLLRLAPERRAETLAAVEEVWRAFVPDRPFEYTFLDDRIDRMYQDDARVGRLFNTFALLAIVIACLGLLGLAAFAAERRTKEIGVRKVLGANVVQLVGLLTREFVTLVLISAALAAPLAYLAMERWLEDFAYRIPLSWQTFALAGLLALAIALSTVSFQAVRAAMANPIDALRYE